MRNQNQIAINNSDVERIDSKQALYMQVGDVAIVRSKNVSHLGDHFILVTGRPVEKPHGLRPQTVEFPADQNAVSLLNNFGNHEMLVILKLKDKAKEEFMNKKGLVVNNNEVLIKTV